MSIFEVYPSIIPSMDVDLEKMCAILQDVKDQKREIGGIKVGSLLIWKYGFETVINKIRDICDFPIIFDAQKGGTDIPSIVEEQIELVSDYGIEAFIASPLGSGLKTLEAFIDKSFKSDIIPIILLEMTHPLANAYLKYNAGEAILIRSIKMGVENFVAPGNNPDRIKAYRDLAVNNGKEIKIFSPGVGPQGGGPDKAVSAGTDFLIIGRSIYQAENPREQVANAYELMLLGYKSRRNHS